jgi:hypothetical protein
MVSKAVTCLLLGTGFLTKERVYWSMVETKEVYFKNRLSPTFKTRGLRRVSLHHHFSITSSSNIRIFEDKSADLTRQTYGDVRFDKSTIRHRIFEYSGLTESKCRSMRIYGSMSKNVTPVNAQSLQIIRPQDDCIHYRFRDDLGNRLAWTTWALYRSQHPERT